MITIYILSFIIFLLLFTLGFLCWKLYVAISIIAVFESDLSDNIEVLDNVEKAIENLLQLKMFFDSNEIQMLVKEVMDRIKLAKLQVGKTTKRFTDRSKNKYYYIEEVVEPDHDEFQVVPVNNKGNSR